jgi:bifunctional non-homologous end joining protein LigD
VSIAGVHISHPDRLLFPELGITKADVARYYDRIAERMLPHVTGRPLTLLRCAGPIDPKADKGGCMMIKHGRAWGPLPLRRVAIQELKKMGEYLVAEDRAGLVSLAQMGVVEVHVWCSRADAPYAHDQLVLDLDPGPRVAWPKVVGGAHALSALLSDHGLRSWVKTTGGKGLHVVVPIQPTDWQICLAFCRIVADALVRDDRKLYTVAIPKAGREDKILIDTLRNNRANTAVCAYSLRARAGAPVSMPIAWEELTARLNPASFSIATVAAQPPQRRDDPWSEFWSTQQRLPV